MARNPAHATAGACGRPPALPGRRVADPAALFHLARGRDSGRSGDAEGVVEDGCPGCRCLGSRAGDCGRGPGGSGGRPGRRACRRHAGVQTAAWRAGGRQGQHACRRPAGHPGKAGAGGQHRGSGCTGRRQAACGGCHRDRQDFPTVPLVAMPADPESSSPQMFGRALQNTDPGSNAGIPGAQLPAGLGPRTGLPVGMELDGPAGSDRHLIAIGLAVEALLGRLPAPAPAAEQRQVLPRVIACLPLRPMPARRRRGARCSGPSGP